MLGISRSNCYSNPKDGRRGRLLAPVDAAHAKAVEQFAKEYPCWGCKRLAVVCRQWDLKDSNRLVYRVMRGVNLLQHGRVGEVE